MQQMKLIAMAFAMAFSANALALTWVAPSTNQSDKIASTTNVTLQTSLINTWLSAYDKIITTNKAYLAKVETYTPELQASIKAGSTYQYFVESTKYYESEVAKIRLIQAGGAVSPGTTTTTAAPTTATAVPVTSLIDAPAGADIYTLGTPTAGYVGKTPESFRTAEFLRSTDLSQIKAEFACR